MRLFVFLFVFSLLIGIKSGFAQSFTVEQVPNPKREHGGLVSDPQQILSEEDARRLEQLTTTLEKETSVQAAIVILPSIGEQDLTDFAQQLFQKWGIGQNQNDNGLLLLLVLDIRTIRTHTGYGIEGVLPDAITKRVQLENMLPYFKEGKYGEGLYQGLAEYSRILSDPKYAEEVKATSSSEVEESFPVWVALLIWLFLTVFGFISEFVSAEGVKRASEFPNDKFSKSTWLILHAVIPCLIISSLILTGQPLWITGAVVYGYELIFALSRVFWFVRISDQIKNRNDFYKAFQYINHRLRIVYWYVVSFPIPFLFILFLLWAYRKKLRNEPRPCRSCGKLLHKLSESEDDAHLSEGKKFEEQILSVDYDVWSCSSCGSKQILRYSGKKTHYEECPKCEVTAYYVSSVVTLVTATTSREGMKEETKTCKFCGLANSRRYSVPKLESSSGSGGGGSGGGSFGGGSSGGGGSSSSW